MRRLAGAAAAGDGAGRGAAGGGGLEVCRRVRQAGTTRIVALVSVGDLAAIAAWFCAGADNVVPKPFTPSQLVARLHASLWHL